MSTYAIRAGGGPCTTDPVTGEHHHHYPDIVLTAPEFGQPAPVHTLTPEAEAAVASMRSLGYRQRVDRIISSLVTEHGHKRIVPHGKIPAALVRIRKLAESKGWRVTTYTSETGAALQGRRGDLGFRATWQHGKTRGATWHERKARWTLVEDRRPIKMNERDHVGLKGYRSTGMGTSRLKLLATPDGLPINVTELEERIAKS